eukprot:RCo046099
MAAEQSARQATAQSVPIPEPMYDQEVYGDLSAAPEDEVPAFLQGLVGSSSGAEPGQDCSDSEGESGDSEGSSSSKDFERESAENPFKAKGLAFSEGFEEHSRDAPRCGGRPALSLPAPRTSGGVGVEFGLKGSTLGGTSAAVPRNEPPAGPTFPVETPPRKKLLVLPPPRS